MIPEPSLQPNLGGMPSTPPQLVGSTAIGLEMYDDTAEFTDHTMSTLATSSSPYCSSTPAQISTTRRQSNTICPTNLQMQTSAANIQTLDTSDLDETIFAALTPRQSSFTKQKSSSVLSPNPQKRRYSTGHAKGEETYSLQLRKYIELERRRCQDQGLIFSETGFDPAITKAFESSSIGGANLESLKILYFGIGSPEILVILQDLLKIRRERSANQQSRGKHKISPADRVRAITDGDETIAYFSFRKRCHVYQLSVDWSSESSRTIDGFVQNTTRSMATRHTSQIGNPQNLEISHTIISQLRPNLKPGDQEYKRMRKYISNLRKLGQRLQLLVEKFDYGILGLIPLPGNEPTLLQALNITDNAYVTFSPMYYSILICNRRRIQCIPDNQFKLFITHLDRVHGNYLRAMSRAVASVVSAVFNEEEDHLESFAIEHYEQTQLIQYPRGSPELLRLVS